MKQTLRYTLLFLTVIIGAWIGFLQDFLIERFLGEKIFAYVGTHDMWIFISSVLVAALIWTIGELRKARSVAKEHREKQEAFDSRVDKLYRAIVKIRDALKVQQEEAEEQRVFGGEQSYHGDWKSEKASGIAEAKTAAREIREMVFQGATLPEGVDGEQLLEICDALRGDYLEGAELHKLADRVYSLFVLADKRKATPPASETSGAQLGKEKKRANPQVSSFVCPLFPRLA